MSQPNKPHKQELARQVQRRPSTLLDHDAVVEAYKRNGLGVAVGAFFSRAGGRPCVCPFGAILVDQRAVDELGNNLRGRELEEYENFVDIAADLLDVSSDDVAELIAGFDGESMRGQPSAIFTEGRTLYGVLERYARTANVPVWRKAPVGKPGQRRR